MKYFKSLLLALALTMPAVINVASYATIALVSTGCQTARLEPGGPYAPTNAAPDIALFQVDSAYLLAYNTLDTVFLLEKNNRPLLWSISPNIKKTLDEIRPEAVKVRNDYHAARKAYLSSPTPSGLTLLEAVLSKAQQLANAAQAIIPRINPNA